MGQALLDLYRLIPKPLLNGFVVAEHAFEQGDVDFTVAVFPDFRTRGLFVDRRVAALQLGKNIAIADAVNFYQRGVADGVGVISI